MLKALRPDLFEDEPAQLLEDSRDSLQGRSILVAEDNKTNQLVIQGMLKRLGADITLVENGKDAVARLSEKDQKFDLVLMDCEMPILDGFDATRSVRDLGGEYLHLPILALTAHAVPDKLQQCTEAGMNGYISKPVSFAALQEGIGRVL